MSNTLYLEILSHYFLLKLPMHYMMSLLILRSHTHKNLVLLQFGFEQNLYPIQTQVSFQLLLI